MRNAIGHVFSGFKFLGVILVTAIPFGIYDLIEALDVPMLLTEVEAAEKLASRCGEDAPRLREFLKKMHRLGMASLAARNPIQF